jgi:crotonobetainyl-CoA:carnitine CoA-transferase CaiB-like acyl-CoA transferase
MNEPGADVAATGVVATARALAGVVVVELGHGVAGPFAARLLADLGADVLKVEQPGAGDFARRLEPCLVDDMGATSSALFEYLNWNKRSATLDLHEEAGREAVRRLAGRADIVIESFRPGRLEAWGLGQGALRGLNPRLVVTSVSNFGQTGPYAGYRAGDLVFQAMSGLMQISGTSDREPLKRGLRQSLYTAGINAAYVSLAAYYASLTSGAGAHLDLSILECLCSELVLNDAYYASMGAVQGRRPAKRDPLGGPLGGGDPLPVSDGYVALQINPQLPVARLADLFDEPRLAGPEFASTAARLEHANELNELLAGHLANRSGREFFIEASEDGYLCGFVQGAAELLDCPQLRERGVFHSFPGLPAEGAPLAFPAVLAALSRTPVTIRHRAPRLGEHTDEILAELGKPATDAAVPAAPRPDPDQRPLAGLRVLDLSYVFATPYMGGLLSDLGAEVIKVEAPHRLDQTRSAFSPFFENDPGHEFWDRAGAFHVVNRGKRSLSLDLGTEAGRDVLRALIEQSDVLLENFTPRVMRKWGLTYDELAKLNPGLIMLSNTGYGSTGPWSAFRAQGTTLEATMGVAQYTGYDGGPPSKAGQSYPDFLACWSGLLTIMAALVHRRRSGKGQWIDLGMYQLGVSVLADGLLCFQATGDEPRRCGSRELDALFSGVFPASGDDRWLAVSVTSAEELGALLGVIADPELDGLAASALPEEELRGLLEPAVTVWSRELDAVDGAARLQAAGVAAGPVHDARDLLHDPQLRERCFYEWVDCGEGMLRPLIGRPYRWQSDASTVSIRGCAPDFGEGNVYVLQEILGLADDAVARLRAEGVVTDAPVGVDPLPAIDLSVMLANGALARMDADYLDAITVGGGTT